MKTVILIVIFVLFSAHAYAQRGYTSTPWGSNTWTGPGKPPHWSQSQNRGQNSSKPDKYEGSIKHHNHTKYHKKHYRHTGKKVILVKEEEHVQYPSVRKHKTNIKTRIVPIQRKTSMSFCGGDTVYLRDRNTGEIIINYVSAAQSCK